MARARALALLIHAAAWAVAAPTPGVVTALAGCTCGSNPDSGGINLGGVATATQLTWPYSAAVDATGTVYVALPFSECVAKVRKRHVLQLQHR
jgi:hypothetical protein